MDGKAVGRAVNARMRPLLRAAGFDQFSGRRAWRRSEHTIEHVVFRSFPANIAYGVGCTTYSFTAELGVFYRQFDPAKARPKEYELTFEASLGTTLRQPVFNPYGSYGPGTFKDRADIWYVAEDGSNLTDTIEDAASCLLTQGLPFLDKMSDPARAFEALRTEDSNNGYDTYGSLGVTMPGAPGSPHWQEVAWAIGRMVMDDPSDAIRTAPSVLEDERRRARRRASD